MNYILHDLFALQTLAWNFNVNSFQWDKNSLRMVVYLNNQIRDWYVWSFEFHDYNKNTNIFNMQIEVFGLIIERSSDLKENLVQSAKSISQHFLSARYIPYVQKRIERTKKNYQWRFRLLINGFSIQFHLLHHVRRP